MNLKYFNNIRKNQNVHNKFKKGQFIRILFSDENNKVNIFQGKIIKKHKTTHTFTLTLQKNIKGISIQKIFPLNAPFIKDIQILEENYLN